MVLLEVTRYIISKVWNRRTSQLVVWTVQGLGFLGGRTVEHRGGK